MLINILLLLIFLVCLAYLAAGLRRMEADMSAGRREMQRLGRQRAEVDGAITTLQGMIKEEENKVAAIIVEMEKLAILKEEAEIQLQQAIDAPKQRLFVFDKTTWSMASCGRR